MSSINIINRCTKSHNGGGLPFYNSGVPIPEPDPLAPFTQTGLYFFSAINKGFNTDVGLWYVPLNKVPTFQIVVPDGTFSKFDYVGSLGAGNFSGVTFTPPTSSITITRITINGATTYMYETDDATVLSPACSAGRWILRIITASGTYYSEEFITKDC